MTVKLSSVVLSVKSYEMHVQRYLEAGGPVGRSSGLGWSWMRTSLGSGWKRGCGNGGGCLGSVHGMKREDAPGTDFWTLIFKTGSMCEKQVREPSGKRV